MKAHTYSHVKNEINKRDGVLLSKTYINNATNLEIKCKCGYIFYKTYSAITHRGSWCDSCRKIKLRERFALSLSFVRSEIEKRGGILLDDTYKNAHTTMNIICKNNHSFYMNYCNIKNNKWCGECSFEKTQKFLAGLFKEIYPNYTVFYNYHKFDWLKTYKSGKQELDIFIPELKLAVEYDGELHFIPVKYFGGVERLRRSKKLDKLKNKKIKDHPNDIKYFIRFNYKEKNKLSKEYVMERLTKLGVPNG